MEFSKEKKQIKSKLFSKRYFLVLFFLMFLVVTLFPTHTIRAYDFRTATIAGQNFETSNTPNTEQLNNEKCNLLSNPGKCLILPLFLFSGFLLTLSGTIFTWIINADNIKYIISDNTAIYSSWAFVRDILNMAFIMVLLFSAFCTIFQIEQYNYKKLLWKIVLMALLVNFSFPIARFIIDASNILMYTLIKSSLFGTGEAAKSITTITDGSGLGSLINSSTKDISNTVLLANTVMIFMLAITFLAIGILLLIRIIALAILIILSPIAFTGSIMPGVSSYSSQWWDNLFKYSFFGPIMIFGVSIAVKLMNDTTNMDRIKNLAKAAGKTAADSTFLGQIGIVAIPIVLLWMVMGIAQKLSIAGAGAVMGAAQGAMKWAGKAPGKAAWWGIKKTGAPEGVKMGWQNFKKTGTLFGKKPFGGGSDAVTARAERTAGLIGGGIPGREAAKKTQERSKVKQTEKEWEEKGGKSKEELKEMINKEGDPRYSRTDRLAAASQLAKKSDIDDVETYENARKLMKTKKVNALNGKKEEVDDDYYVNNLDEGVKKKRRDLILAHKVNEKSKGTDADGNPIPNTLKLQEELGKLTYADLGSVDFENLAANTQASGRGGEEALQDFFKDTTADEKIQIGRHVNKENFTYLKNHFEVEKPEVRTKKQSAESRPPSEETKKEDDFDNSAIIDAESGGKNTKQV